MTIKLSTKAMNDIHWTSHVPDPLLLISNPSLVAAIEFHESIPEHHAHLQPSCRTKKRHHSSAVAGGQRRKAASELGGTSATGGLPSSSTRKCSCRSRQSPLRPALALLAGNNPALEPVGAHYPPSREQVHPGRGDRKTDRQSGVLVTLATSHASI